MARSGGGRSGGGASRSSSRSSGRSFSSGRSSSRSFSSSSSRSGSSSSSRSSLSSFSSRSGSSISRSSGGGFGGGFGSIGGGSRPSRPIVNNVFINNTRADFDRTPSFGGPASYGGGYSGGVYGSSKKESGSGVGKFILTLVIFFGIIFLILALLSSTVNRDIPDSTIERKPLPVGAAQGDVIVYRDDTGDGDWFDNRSVLMAGATEAYNLTGVKFGILATRDINGNISPSESELAAYADELYQEWFPDDEAHLLMVVVDQPHRDGYHVYYKMGISTLSVFDDQAIDVLDSYLYKYWVSTMTTSEMFSKVLSDTAKHIMQVTKSPVEALAPWIIVEFVICLIIGIMPAILRMKARKKEAEAERMRAEAELLGTPIAGLDTEPMSASELADKYLAEQGIPITPKYKAPENPLDDPYSPKPAGYAAKQAEMGYPKSQAVRPAVSPEEADLSDDNELVFGTFESFATAMRGLGSDDSDEELTARYEQYKKENNIED